MNIGSILIAIDAQISGLNSGLRNASSSISRFSQQTMSDLKRLDGAMQALGGVFAAGGAAIGGTLLYAANQAAKADSDFRVLQSTANRLGVDFEALNKTLNSVASGFGLTARQTTEAASTLLRAGASIDQVAALLQAAGASAVLTGTDIQTAWTNVAVAVVTGRSELLETSGIITNFGPVLQQYASSVGKTVDELSNQEKVTASINAILQETRPEVELMGESIGGLSIASAQFKSSLNELVINIGDMLLPDLIKLINISNQLIGVWEVLPQESKTNAIQMGELVTGVGAAATGFIALKGVLGAVIPAFGAIGSTLLNLAKSPMTYVIVALGSLAKGFYTSTEATIPWLNILYKVIDVLGGVAGVMLGVTQVLVGLAQGIGSIIGSLFIALVESIQALPNSLYVVETWKVTLLQLFQELVTGITPVAESFKQLFSGDFSGAFTSLQTSFNTLKTLVTTGLSELTESARVETTNFINTSIVDPINSAWSRVNFDPMLKALDNGATTISVGGMKIANAFDSSVTSPTQIAIENLSNTATEALVSVQSFASGIDWSGATVSVNAAGESVDYMSNALNTVPDASANASAGLAGVANTANNTSSAFQQLSESIASMGSTLPSGISSLGKSLSDAGVAGESFNNTLSGLEEKSKLGTSNLDQFDQKILDVYQSLQKGDITQEQAGTFVKRLKEMQTETQGIAKAEKDREETNQKLSNIQDQQSAKVSEQSDATDKLNKSQKEGNANNKEALGNIEKQTDKVKTKESERNKQLKDSNKQLADQLGRLKDIGKQQAKNSAPTGGGSNPKRTPEVEKTIKELAYGDIYGSLGTSLTKITKDGLTKGLKDGAAGKDWESELRNSLQQSIMDAVITGFTTALMKTPPIKGMIENLTNTLSSSLQNSLNSIKPNSTFGGTSSTFKPSNNNISNSSPSSFMNTGSSSPLGNPVIDPLAGGDPIASINNYMDTLIGATEKTLKKLKPLFNAFNDSTANALSKKIKDSLTSAVGSSVSSALSEAMNGGDWRLALRKNMYESVLRGIGDSLTAQITTKYTSLINDLTNAIINGSSSAIDSAFSKIDRMINAITSKLSGVMGKVENVGSQLKLQEEASKAPEMQRNSRNWNVDTFGVEVKEWTKEAAKFFDLSTEVSTTFQEYTDAINQYIEAGNSFSPQEMQNQILMGSGFSPDGGAAWWESWSQGGEQWMSALAQQWEDLVSELDVIFKDTINSGLSAGISSFLEGDSDWKANMQEAFRSTILKGMVDAILQKGIVEGMLSPVLAAINSSIASGNYAAAGDYVAQFMQNTLPEVENVMSSVLAPLYGVLAPQGSNADTSASTAALNTFEIKGPQYEDPSITSSSGKTDKSANTFYDAAAMFEDSVNAFINPQVAANREFNAAVSSFSASIDKFGRLNSTVPTANMVPNSTLV